MTIRRFRGDAPAVAQVDTLTVGGTIEADDLFVMTINGKSLSVVAGATDPDTVRDTLVAAWNASTLPEFAEITASPAVATGALTLTADVAGRPFVLSVTTTETDDSPADDQTFAHVTTTASAGPQHWDTPTNWTGAAVPGNGDDVVLDRGKVDILYGLDQSGITLNSLTIEQGYTGRLGLPELNESATTSYREYRTTALRIGANSISIGVGEGSGSPRIKLDTGSVQTTLHVLNSGTSGDAGLPAIQFAGTHAANEVHLLKGSLGIALSADDAATVAVLRVGYRTNPSGDAVLRCGSAVTLDAVEQSGGTVTLASDVNSVNMTDGELVYLAGTMGTLNLDGGAVRYRSAGTLSLAQVGSGGTLDFRQDMRSRTVTQCNLYERFGYHDPFGTVVLTNGWDFIRCTPSDGTLQIAPHQTLTPASI